MSKTELDKALREKFLDHEGTSKAYTPDHWKNFEQQLERKMPLRRKNRFGFSLNQFLFFSTFALILIAILFFPDYTGLNASSNHALQINSKSRNVDFKINKTPVVSLQKNEVLASIQNSFNKGAYINKLPNNQSETADYLSKANKDKPEGNNNEDVNPDKNLASENSINKSSDIQSGVKTQASSKISDTSVIVTKDKAMDNNDSSKTSASNKNSKKGTLQRIYVKRVKLIPVTFIGF
jgi:hypothetical protein